MEGGVGGDGAGVLDLASDVHLRVGGLSRVVPAHNGELLFLSFCALLGLCLFFLFLQPSSGPRRHVQITAGTSVQNIQNYTYTKYTLGRLESSEALIPSIN